MGTIEKQKTTHQGKPDVILKRRGTNNSDESDKECVKKLNKPPEDEESEESKKKASIFSSLIQVAASMNPQQFELPNELTEPVSFPGIIFPIIDY